MDQPLSFAPGPALKLGVLKASCSACSMHQLCLPMGLDDADINRLDQIIGRRRRLARDERLYQMGEPFRNLYAVRIGHFKTFQVNAAGEQQITGFQMAGELLGMDAISGDRHHCDAVALEDSEVCEIPGPDHRKHQPPAVALQEAGPAAGRQARGDAAGTAAPEGDGGRHRTLQPDGMTGGPARALD
jgi:CRP-like cAMP-binding protein